MALTLRAQRLIDAKREVEKSKTLVSKIAALRELLAVPNVGRNYRRWSHKKLIEFRAEAVTAGNDELIRRLDTLDERLVLHAESEKSRLDRKHQREASEKRNKKTEPSVPVAQVPAAADDLIKLWGGDEQ